MESNIERDKRKTDKYGNGIACISLRVPVQEHRTWSEKAAGQGITLTWLIRLSVAAYLKSNGG